MPSEDDLIARYFAPLAGKAGLGLRDDAALITPPAGRDLVITTDALVAGVHFFASDPPASIARKALRVNLSDLAAKGAEPLGFLLNLALPQGITEDWIAAFTEGIGEDAAAYHCPLLGGDTVKASGGLTLAITALGHCEAGRMVRRTTGKAGDRLVVSGTIGDAALGLQIRLQPDAGWVRALSASARAYLLDRYLHPQPATHLAPSLARHVTAAMDVSDGLLGDALKLARAAQASAPLNPVIDLGKVPLSAAAREALSLDASLITTIATGGDDYVILATIREHADARGPGDDHTGTWTIVGHLQATPEPLFLDLDGQPMQLDRLKFEHGF